MKTARNWRPDFEMAMGETFAECICPPVPFEHATPQECCEVIWDAVGRDVTPTCLAALTEAEIAELAARFGRAFEAPQPSPDQVKEAIRRTLARWPAGSIDENA